MVALHDSWSENALSEVSEKMGHLKESGVIGDLCGDTIEDMLPEEFDLLVFMEVSTKEVELDAVHCSLE